MVFITRHGNRQDFVDASWTDTAARPDDPDLSPDGLRQAMELAGRLGREPIVHLFSSPYLRAVHTASLCAARHHLPIKVEDGIGEFLEVAKFTAQPMLLSRAELARSFPIDPAYRPIYEPTFPESKQVLLSRCRAVIEALLARTRGNLLLVGHGASCKALIYALLGRQFKLEVPLCSLTQLVKENDGWRLQLNGDTSFLSGGAVYGERF